MKKMLFASGAASVLACGSVWADDHGDNPSFNPVETYTCNYNEGMGPDDLDDAVAGWNEWMDSQDSNDYFALTATPVYFGPETFDFAWLGSWGNGKQMGEGTDMWLGEGGEHAAKFAAVATCDTHSGFASMTIKPPANDTPPDNVVLTFADCKITTEDPEFDLFGTYDAWDALLTERNYQQGLWAMFPVYGGGGAEYDFKFVQGFDSYSALGSDWDLYASGDYRKNWEIVGGAWQCDDARVYNGTVRRRADRD